MASRFLKQEGVVREVGLEPTRLIQPTDFKSVAYTNSATRAWRCVRVMLPSTGFCRPMPNFSANAPSPVVYKSTPQTTTRAASIHQQLNCWPNPPKPLLNMVEKFSTDRLLLE